jgi:hypothetical protein
MKKNKIIYWSTTGLFAAFMTFSAIPDMLKVPEAIQFITHLGYPEYFIPFIGLAKLLGSISILIPSFKKIKEWAYAGLVFDLIAAVYSIFMTDGYDPGMLMMIPIFAVVATSYIYNTKVNGVN